jgi:hypothetical protein
MIRIGTQTFAIAVLLTEPSILTFCFYFHHRERLSPYDDKPTTMWSIIEENPTYLEKLKLLVDPEKILLSAGYVMQPLEPELVELKKRCRDCGGE